MPRSSATREVTHHLGTSGVANGERALEDFWMEWIRCCQREKLQGYTSGCHVSFFCNPQEMSELTSGRCSQPMHLEETDDSRNCLNPFRVQ